MFKLSIEYWYFNDFLTPIVFNFCGYILYCGSLTLTKALTLTSSFSNHYNSSCVPSSFPFLWCMVFPLNLVDGNRVNIDLVFSIWFMERLWKWISTLRLSGLETQWIVIKHKIIEINDILSCKSSSRSKCPYL